MSGNRGRWIVGAIVIGAILVVPVGRGVRSLWMTRGGMAAFTRLVASANSQDSQAVRSLCSARYLSSHEIRPSSEGGMIGFPRNIHKNFQVWTERDEVHLCPTDRVGPVYRLILEAGTWKFDGLVGLLRKGRIEPPEPDA